MNGAATTNPTDASTRSTARFSARVGVYFALLDDRYPSTDDHQSVTLDYPYPDAERELSRGLPLVKWFLAIPHYIVLLFLYIGAVFMVIAAWFAILFTGRMPRGIFDYLVGDSKVLSFQPAGRVQQQYDHFRMID